jgi:hypothetical protein
VQPTFASFVASGALSHADPVPEPTVQLAPVENLEHIAVGLIDRAKQEELRN